MSIWMDFTDRYVLESISNLDIDVDIFWFDFVFVKLHAVPPIFSFNVQTDYDNGKLQHFADELPDYLGWIQLGPVSTYGAKEAFSWKILTEMISILTNVERFWN